VEIEAAKSKGIMNPRSNGDHFIASLSLTPKAVNIYEFATNIQHKAEASCDGFVPMNDSTTVDIRTFIAFALYHSNALVAFQKYKNVNVQHVAITVNQYGTSRDRTIFHVRCNNILKMANISSKRAI
jgi:cytochrome c